jgi:hypothetical protein
MKVVINVHEGSKQYLSLINFLCLNDYDYNLKE